MSEELDQYEENNRVYYTLDGKEVSEENEKKAYAMKVILNNGTEKYYVKYSGGKIFNPVDPMNPAVRSRVNGYDSFKFRKVSHEVFDLYMKFLKTRNESYYLNAERKRGD